jgi:hypothetical protein
MLTTDFSNRSYTAEVLRTAKDGTPAVNTIEQLLVGRWEKEAFPLGKDMTVDLYHGYLASRLPHHRVRRSVTAGDGTQIDIPRTKDIRGHENFLYDVLVAHRGQTVVVAVPFHGLASEFFVKVDDKLAGSKTMYHRLDITNLVVRLGGVRPAKSRDGSADDIGVTRCHLSYSDPAGRRRDIEQVRLSGSNLRKSDIYQRLVGPVLRPSESPLRVTPILLGFASFLGDVKRAGATTDRHGNFKIWVSPGLRQMCRLFSLLDTLEDWKEVVSPTGNIPILQSSGLEDVD